MPFDDIERQGGYWLPPPLRLIHGAEILADSLVYAGVLVFLLVHKKELAEQMYRRAEFIPTLVGTLDSARVASMPPIPTMSGQVPGGAT